MINRRKPLTLRSNLVLPWLPIVACVLKRALFLFRGNQIFQLAAHWLWCEHFAALPPGQFNVTMSRSDDRLFSFEEYPCPISNSNRLTTRVSMCSRA